MLYIDTFACFDAICNTLYC